MPVFIQYLATPCPYPRDFTARGGGETLNPNPAQKKSMVDGKGRKESCQSMERVRAAPNLLRPRLASAGGLGLLAAGAALGACLDVELNLRVMHVALAISFVLLAVLMLKVQIGRFYRPDKGPTDWVAWLHFVIFAFLLFLAARMLRRWGRRCPSVVAAAPFPPHADVDHNDDDHVATLRRLVVTYRGGSMMARLGGAAPGREHHLGGQWTHVGGVEGARRGLARQRAARLYRKDDRSGRRWRGLSSHACARVILFFLHPFYSTIL